MIMNYLTLVTMILLVTCLECNNVTDDSSGLLTGVKVIYNMYQQCEVQDDMLACLKFKLCKVLDRAIRADNIQILEGLSLVKNEEEESRDIVKYMIDIDESMLSEDIDERNRELDEFLLDRAIRFFKSHSFQFNLQQVFSSAGKHFYDQFVEEGRDIKKKKKEKKLKKYLGPLLAGFMMKSAIMMAMTYKGVSLLAGKALLVAKAALVAAAINALKKFQKGEKGGGQSEHSYGGGGGDDYHSGGGGGDYGGTGGGGDYGGGGGGGSEGPYRRRNFRSINLQNRLHEKAVKRSLR